MSHTLPRGGTDYVAQATDYVAQATDYVAQATDYVARATDCDATWYLLEVESTRQSPVGTTTVLAISFYRASS